jgi:cytochrome c biogenesis protein CcmG, thiol:disulfide interchange protein DsbE
MKMQRMLKCIALLSLLIVCFAAEFPGQTVKTPKPAENAIPNLTLNTIDGKQWSLYDNLGKPLVLNFWATWCEPCRTEIPMLVKVVDDYEKQGLKVVGIALDEGEPEIIKKFAAEYKIDYPILMPEPNSPLLRIENLPMTLLIDAEGRLAKKYVGAMPERVLREDLEILTKKPDKNETGSGNY